MHEPEKEIDHAFLRAIAQADVPAEDEKKLYAMKEYIKLTAAKRFVIQVSFVL